MNLCAKHDYGSGLKISEKHLSAPSPALRPPPNPIQSAYQFQDSEFPPLNSFPGTSGQSSLVQSNSRSFDSSTNSNLIKAQKPVSSDFFFRYFKQRYLVETAWRTGGKNIARNITQDQGVVTSLHLTSKYIVVALDNAKIHVFNTEGGQQKTLQGHVMGVWAMVPWEDTLVSGGCDRDVRVWNMATG